MFEDNTFFMNVTEFTAWMMHKSLLCLLIVLTIVYPNDIFTHIIQGRYTGTGQILYFTLVTVKRLDGYV